MIEYNFHGTILTLKINTFLTKTKKMFSFSQQVIAYPENCEKNIYIKVYTVTILKLFTGLFKNLNKNITKITQRDLLLLIFTNINTNYL